MMRRALIAVIAILAINGCGVRFGGPSPDDEVYLHKVEPGQSLSDIAERYYGDPDRADMLRHYNELDDAPLEAGATVRVPMSERDMERLRLRQEARVPYEQGLTYAQRGAYVDAVERFRQALEIDPDYVEARYNLGVALQQMKAYDKALGEFKRAARARPDEAEYHFGIGNSYFYLQRYREASRAFERVIDESPRHRKAQYSLAVCYERMHERDKARAAWERYLEIDGKSAWAQEARKRLEELR